MIENVEHLTYNIKCIFYLPSKIYTLRMDAVRNNITFFIFYLQYFDDDSFVYFVNCKTDKDFSIFFLNAIFICGELN